MPYKFVEGITVADVAFQASGESLEELLESCGTALTATMVKDAGRVEKKTAKTIQLSAKDEERLVHDFLEELIFLKDAELLLFSEFKVKTAKEEDGTLKLEAVLKGEKIDPKRHELLVDVKAATWHEFKVERTAKGFSAQVVLDV